MDKKAARLRRATRARKKMQELGATRLVVHRTPRHIYAQVIAANGSEVLASASTVEKAISEALKARGILVTRLARGVPIGSELEYVDLGTIAHALVDRR